jgi:DNA-binding response OmpR family regulator
VLIYGDREKIEIILFNLLSNAFKYTPSHGKITLELIETDKEVQVIVADTGVGITPNVGNKLFDVFYQADNAGKGSQTGFGIGLYVSRKLALAHKGDLQYTSEPGRGTQFRLCLLKGNRHLDIPNEASVPIENTKGPRILQELVEDPELIVESVTSLEHNESQVIDHIMSGLPKMVVADDNAEMRAYLKEIFKSDFVIYEAADGKEALRMVTKEMPEIVISDVIMPEMGGIDLCRKIKETDELAHIPVILLTASASEASRLKGIEGGAEDYITKPFDKDLILARVQNILKGRNRLQQYFFNTVTLKPLAGIDDDHKEFIERCIQIIENHLDDPDFTIPAFCREIGMSHPNLYKKIKAVSGLTVNVFIRYLRLRKAAQLLMQTNKKTSEVAYLTGFNDVKYFREQFFKLFGMKPADFIHRYRNLSGKADKTDKNDTLPL